MRIYSCACMVVVGLLPTCSGDFTYMGVPHEVVHDTTAVALFALFGLSELFVVLRHPSLSRQEFLWRSRMLAFFWTTWLMALLHLVFQRKIARHCNELSWGWAYEWLASISYICQCQLIWYFSGRDVSWQDRVICIVTFISLGSLGPAHLVISHAGWRLLPYEALGSSLLFCCCIRFIRSWRKPIKIGMSDDEAPDPSES
eukprot:gnl/TRDRNA2_/TRDRNA2_135865_c0_seq2.p1 gnl/TRDRNA2_/TRDRNA2_135865_c0~~gnl/TRDRNA2_/TRDRNA2_135865_c0_seq2.p1  ORF type:complete len:200 (-),score=9.46 gnl/TRDRNA2_/TRDRNA2_135865_c0_seq2:35-634(-)